ncbi:hypothetical protein C8R46DRAFT_1061865 [Mycena filopes]|nr:hypothetical protein C8R46DRAFT_1061865 [Mycena filopes]
MSLFLTLLALVLGYRYLSPLEAIPPPQDSDETDDDDDLEDIFVTLPGRFSDDFPVASDDDEEDAHNDTSASSLIECRGCFSMVPASSGSTCPGCTEVYCGVHCLESAADWHARFCANPRRPLTTADTLARAAFRDEFPDDEQTNDDYFFTRTRSANDRTMLFGLYIGVLKIHNLGPSKLHEWRLAGTMVDNIKALYEPIPPSSRGGYYAWFLKNFDIFEPRPSALISLSPRHLCASCGVAAAVRCAACKNVWYCSKRCQQREWPGHLVNCYPGRPIISADRLRAAAHRKKVPLDQETLSDYGFNRVDEVGGKNLLEIYRVVFEEGVHPRDVHRWRISGSLLKEVESLLRRIEFWKRAPFMRWFESHRHAFDPNMPVPEERNPMVDQIHAARIKLWNAVGDFPSHNLDDIHSALRNWSTERATFFCFRASMGLFHPGPDLTEEWISFGFCACHDEGEERFLATTYTMLADRSSYDAFCTAYLNSGLNELMDATGLRPRRLALPYLEDVLTHSPRGFKSVWPLKQHVLHPRSVRSDMEMSVEVDYGFVNCASEDEYQELRSLYTSIFERTGANPLKLHEACISGALYEYVLELNPELKNKKNRAKKFRRLLQNPYLLPEEEKEEEDV